MLWCRGQQWGSKPMLETDTATAPHPAPVHSASAGRSRNNRAAISNDPRRPVIDGRSALGRRVVDLAESFAEACGGWAILSDTAALGVRRAAELAALAEAARADALAGKAIDMAALLRLEGVADRARRQLGIKAAKPAAPPLRERLVAEAERAR
jgi:hypothetical protein